MTDYHLEAKHISCYRQQKKVFENLSFSITQGELLFVEGPNGAGKSSLLRQLAGILSPDGGDIFFQGEPISTSRAHYWQALHYIGHLNGIKLGLTVAENLTLQCHLHGVPLPQTFQAVLNDLQLQADQDTQSRYLSAGQKRRLALARLFLLPKPIWILDEPLTTLDKTMQSFLFQALESHIKKGGMAILSSHQPLAFDSLIPQRLRLASC